MKQSAQTLPSRAFIRSSLPLVVLIALAKTLCLSPPRPTSPHATTSLHKVNRQKPQEKARLQKVAWIHSTASTTTVKILPLCL